MFLWSALRLTPRADLAPFSVDAEGGAFCFAHHNTLVLAVCQDIYVSLDKLEAPHVDCLTWTTTH